MNTSDKINKMLGKKENCPLCGLPAYKDEITKAGCPECYEEED